MKDNAVKFLNAINENAEIRKYMEGYVLPEGVAKEDALVEVAAHFGFDLTKEELEEAALLRQEELKAAASDAEAAIRELSPDELDKVAGGNVIISDETSEAGTITPTKDHSECKSTFWLYENCFFVDGCEVLILYYDNYHY